MKNIFIIVIIAGIVSCIQKPVKISYPMSKKVDTVDVYFGTKVSDPYRWLEDDMSDETAEWVKAQNEVTQNYLSTIPFREKVKERYKQLFDYPKISAPFHKGGHYFVYKNDGLQNQDIVYIKETFNGEEKIILDPNKLSDDGTVALSSFIPSKNGKHIAYGISRGGSDWNEIYVKDIETGNDLSDQIKWVKNSGVSWFKNGFFYVRYPEPKHGNELKGVNVDSKIYYHKIGTLQTDDKLVYEDKENPEWGFDVEVTNDEKFLFAYVYESTSGNALYIKNVEKCAAMQKIVEKFDNDFWVIDHKDGKLLVMTNYKAPKYKVISIDVSNAAPENWTDFIPEKEGVLQAAKIMGGKIIAQYFKDAHSHIEIFDTMGQYHYDLDQTLLGTISGFDGEKEDAFTFYTLTSFTTPATVYKYNIASNTSEKYQESELDFNADNYETKQVFYKSKDATQVPMFIVNKKGIKLNGKNPLLMYGYGGFNISMTPSFSLSRCLWLEQGGVYVMMNLRGGGEYGEEWHKAGTLLQKQNVFDDCIAAAEYMIDKKYTQKGKIALMGGSNGGLLVGAVVNQRPDLFGAAIPMVGVMDMLRYHKFTIGRYWATDYGTSEESEEMFNYLINYSPLHTIKENIDYPAIMVTTADHDDRVVPAHSFKYAATLQDKYKGTNPVVIRIETKAGHGAGKPTAKIIEEYSDIFSFLFFNTGIEPKYQ